MDRRLTSNESYLRWAIEPGIRQFLGSAAPPLTAMLEPGWFMSKRKMEGNVYSFVEVGLLLLKLQHIFSTL